DVRRLEVGPLRCLDLHVSPDDSRGRRRVGRYVQLCDAARCRGGCALDRVGAQRDDRNAAARDRGHRVGAAEGLLRDHHSGRSAGQPDHVALVCGVNSNGEPSTGLARLERVADNDGGNITGLGDGGFERGHLGCDEELLRASEVRHEDGLRAELPQLRSGRGAADDDRGGIAEPSCGGEQFCTGGDGSSAGQFDEYEYVGHGCFSWFFRAQMSFAAARKSAIWVPAVPSSVMTVPPSRGGRGVTVVTTDHEFAPPASPAEIPRSASVRVSTGFFLAAMSPLKFGYRASAICSVTETRAGRVALTSR